MKHKIICFTFIFILAFFMLATIFLPDREYSSLENRYLAEMPTLNVTALLTGDFMDSFETYLADQVVGKDALVSLKSDVELLLNRQGTNGVYFGRDGYFVKEYEPNYTRFEQNLSIIRTFIDRYKEQYTISFLLAPNVQSIYTDILPWDIAMADADADREKAKEIFSDVNYVDPTALLQEHKEEELYFKTDHHWNMLGAYYGYVALGQSLCWKVADISSYHSQIVSDNFYGSLHSKAPLSFTTPDTIEIYTNPTGAYEFTIEDQEPTHTLFVDANLEKKDKYTYFLDGNHSFYQIKSNADTGKKALIFKDSYSHVMLPFLADQYDELDIVDLRYYRDSISTLLNSNEYDDIIFMYNIDFLTTDENFVWLITE